nr:hypothetical protein [uncultured Carboxylicivirga sp.]
MKTVFENYTIEILSDSTYTPNSTDNINSYDLIYPENLGLFSRNISSTKTVINIYEELNLIKSAIICEPHGVTIESESSYVILDSVIYIIARDFVYSINIPDLSLNWSKEVDSVCCLAIYKLERDLLVHGELDIVRINKDGEIKWRFSGRENWINLSGKQEVTIEEHQIRLIDFDSNEYLVDFDGNEIKVGKKWWKFYNNRL